MVDVLLLGDSHHARIRRARLRKLERLTGGLEVVNLAVGGATSGDLGAQLVPSLTADVALVSVGTNDAAPLKCLPLDVFERNVRTFAGQLAVRRLVYVGSPGLHEERMAATNDRTNARIAEYGAVAGSVFCELGGIVLDTVDLLAEVQVDVFEDDGMHLNKAGYDRLLPALAEVVLAVF